MKETDELPPPPPPLLDCEFVIINSVVSDSKPNRLLWAQASGAASTTTRIVESHQQDSTPDKGKLKLLYYSIINRKDEHISISISYIYYLKIKEISIVCKNVKKKRAKKKFRLHSSVKKKANKKCEIFFCPIIKRRPYKPVKKNVTGEKKLCHPYRTGKEKKCAFLKKEKK